MGVIKFLDAHCGTILTICIIVVVVAIVTHYRLKKVSWKFENEPEKEMLHRVFYMCKEIDTILRDLKKNGILAKGKMRGNRHKSDKL